MIQTTLENIARMCGGTLLRQQQGQLAIKGVSTDTRTIGMGSLFVPLSGERFNGHAFVADAFLKGAVASFWQQEETDVPVEGAIILVDDPLMALQRLASAYRKTLDVRVIGITGSNGKTSTKDLLAGMLSGKYKVLKTKGNLNNHIGVPLMLLQLEASTQIAVIEMGMSGAGEIELLTTLAQPEAAIITHIGEAHMEHLGSRAGIARAKLEIVKGMRPNGVLVIPSGSEWLEGELSQIDLPIGTRVIRVGTGELSDYHAEQIQSFDDPPHMSFVPVVNKSQLASRDPVGVQPIKIEIPLLGKHHVSNAMLAYVMAKWCGVRESELLKGIGNIQMTAMRSQVQKSSGGWTVINDAYNASPSSVKAAIESLRGVVQAKRRILILGDMLELGDHEMDMHAEIGRFANPKTEQYVLTYGERSKHTIMAALESFGAERAKHFATKDALLAALSDILLPGDWVLVKGSRGMRMEELVQFIVERIR